MRSRLKFAVFACTPALVLLIGAELFVRAAILVRPSLVTLPLPGEGKIMVPDEELFWSLRPSHRQGYMGVQVATNELGLRSPPVAPRGGNEYRILSLGESTTFGSRVAARKTYTSLLAERLQASEAHRDRRRRFVAINAGVPAYTSFQSLLYLKQRGLELDPDLLLVYHEVNDYLPSSVRDSSNNEVGLLLTDPQLYAMRNSRLRRVSDASALVRLLRLRLARRQVDAFDATSFENPLDEIGLPEFGLPPRLRERGTPPGRTRNPVEESALGTRVSQAERREILAEFARVAEERDIDLVLIHPSYKRSPPHECVLTRFAGERGVAVFEAQDVLHPADLPDGALFRDQWHPNEEGHARLAAALADFVRESVLR